MNSLLGRVIVYIEMTLSCFAVTSCQTESPTSGKSFKDFLGIPLLNGIAFNDIDTNAIDAIVKYSRFREMEPTNSISNTANTNAIFFGSSSVVFPTTVKANSVSLDRESSSMLYSSMSSSLISGNSVRWEIGGYEGASTLYDTTTLPSSMIITSLNPADTVSKSSGFNISYTGYTTTGKIIITVLFDGGLTYIWKDSTTAANGSGSAIIIDNDDGSVSVSSSDLSSFTTGGYISVSITHYEYHTRVTSTGRRVGFITTNTTIIPLYLDL